MKVRRTGSVNASKYTFAEADETDAYLRFRRFTEALVKVPKSEIDAERAKSKDAS